MKRLVKKTWRRESQMALGQWSCVQDVHTHENGRPQERLAPKRISQRNRDVHNGEIRMRLVKTRLRHCVDVEAWHGAGLGANCDCASSYLKVGRLFMFSSSWFRSLYLVTIVRSCSCSSDCTIFVKV